MSGRPFARIYYADLDRDYPGVFRDPALFGTYVRLLCIADASWPARPEFPRSVRRAHLAELLVLGLIATDDRVVYRVKGLDTERSARSNAASHAARIRHDSAPASSHATSPTEPSHTSRAPSPAEARSVLAAFRKQGLPVDVKGS